MVRRCFALMLFALVFAAAGTVTVDAAIAPGPSTPKVKPEDCGPDARPETGLQGQVPLADQRSGRSREGYRCNLALVGQNDIGGRGANFQLAWLGDCAYVGMVGQAFQSPVSPVEKGTKLAGVAVLDVSNPRHPQMVRLLQSGVGGYQHEGLEVHEGRGMLVVEIGGVSARWIEIWDASADCRNPVFKARFDSGRARYHGLRISPDGRTIYATNTFPDAEGLHAIDVSDMASPRLVATWNPLESQLAEQFGVHDLELSPDGRRAYLGVIPPEGYGSLAKGPCCHVTLVILDVTQIEERRPDPMLPVVGTLAAANFGHTLQYARIGGRPHLFVSGENPFVGEPHCPWAWGHLVDIGDERAPRIVSDIRLEVNDPAACPTTGADGANYSIHYVGVDDPDNTTTVFYTYYSGGLRAFDVRNPTAPVEIGYYHPVPLERTAYPPQFFPPGHGFDAQTPAWDAATSVVRYVPESGELWFVSVAAGFQVLRFTPDRAPLPTVASATARPTRPAHPAAPADHAAPAITQSPPIPETTAQPEPAGIGTFRTSGPLYVCSLPAT
jgi:LVIVD repeat-containing protein